MEQVSEFNFFFRMNNISSCIHTLQSLFIHLSVHIWVISRQLTITLTPQFMSCCIEIQSVD